MVVRLIIKLHTYLVNVAYKIWSTLIQDDNTSAIFIIRSYKSLFELHLLIKLYPWVDNYIQDSMLLLKNSNSIRLL